nr:hypothetical protein Iba_chr03fCG5300 [Ipomoea batatas]
MAAKRRQMMPISKTDYEGKRKASTETVRRNLQYWHRKEGVHIHGAYPGIQRKPKIEHRRKEEKELERREEGRQPGKRSQATQPTSRKHKSPEEKGPKGSYKGQIEINSFMNYKVSKSPNVINRASKRNSNPTIMFPGPFVPPMDPFDSASNSNGFLWKTNNVPDLCPNLQNKRASKKEMVSRFLVSNA